ncbi:MAG: nucleotide-diphospho-sugar transferase [Euryarchaeota archaeon]|nr:nucleotide-diphospho-sugar transferase [Marinobacter sp.]
MSSKSRPGRVEFPVLLLAAGASRRMGRAKALLPLPGGGTLLERALAQARQLSPEVRVVAGARYPLIRFRCRRQPARWLFCERWPEGLSASLQAGLDSLGPNARGVFVLVLNQPLLEFRALAAMARLARAEPRQPLAADYGGRPGVPAYLPRELWPAIRGLTGDRGAGQLLAEAGATRLPLAGVRDDVDTPADWSRVCARLSR